MAIKPGTLIPPAFLGDGVDLHGDGVDIGLIFPHWSLVIGRYNQ
jgi:hypothetical protein